MKKISFYDISKKEKERDYHNVLNGIFLNLNENWIWESNKESGRGWFDHLLYNLISKIGYIFEYKIVSDFNKIE